MQHRVRLLEQRTANKNKDTKIEEAKLGILRAEKAKTTENIHNLSGKVWLSEISTFKIFGKFFQKFLADNLNQAIETDRSITSLRNEIRLSKQSLGK